MKTWVMAPLALLAGVGVGRTVLHALHQKERADWKLTPIVVAADQIQAGTVITYDMINQRQVPSMFRTPSMVTPDQASAIVGHVALADLQAGDPLLSTQSGSKVSAAACAQECAWIHASSPS